MATDAAVTAPDRLTLEADRAADLMTTNVVSVRGEATITEVVTLLTDRGLSAVPVIEESGRPVGVVSRADVLVHDREVMLSGRSPTDDETRVRDIMTPAVFSVTAETPADKVVELMVDLNVHQMFVVDGADGQFVVGIISALDIVRRLRRA